MPEKKIESPVLFLGLEGETNKKQHAHRDARECSDASWRAMYRECRDASWRAMYRGVHGVHGVRGVHRGVHYECSCRE